MGKVVCVTGASGYIGSWLVKLLLERGYTVKGTVRSLSDPKKVECLKALEGAAERLHLVEANLTEEGSFDAVVEGCDGVFHTASPVSFDTTDPQKELIDPAVKGTINILKSCKKVSSIKRVVVTSSVAAVMVNKNPLEAGSVVDETWYSDPTFCEETQQWYSLSKTLAEKAAWEFAEENGTDLVMLHPGFVLGPLLQPTLNLSCEVFLNFVKEGKELVPGGVFMYVDVRDVVLAHIIAFENSSAKGRYLLVGSVARSSEMLDILKKIFPASNLPMKKVADNRHMVQPYEVSQEKTKSLGIAYIPLEITLRDTVESLKEKNFLSF